VSKECDLNQKPNVLYEIICFAWFQFTARKKIGKPLSNMRDNISNAS